MLAATYGISGGPIENFREGWAILPFVGGLCKPHYWHRIEMSNRYKSVCGMTGALASPGIKPLAPGVFMMDRCKRCRRKHKQ